MEWASAFGDLGTLIPFVASPTSPCSTSTRSASCSRSGSKDLCTRPQVHTPLPTEGLIEAVRIQSVNGIPALVETLCPAVERQRVMSPQVLYIEHLEAAALHPVERLGQARDPPAGEDVLTDEELGVSRANVADEMNHTDPSGLERVGVRPDHLGQLTLASVLQCADRQQLVVLARISRKSHSTRWILSASPRCASSARSSVTCSVVVLMPVPNAP